MMRKSVLSFFLAFSVVALAGGCVKLSKPYPDVSHYLIELPSGSGEAVAAPLDRSLTVRPFTVSPAFDKQGFVYRRLDGKGGAGEYVEDFYVRHLVAPHEAIEAATRTWLAEAGLFRHVSGPSSIQAADMVLEGHLRRLYVATDSSAKDARAAVLELELAFFDLSDQAPKTVSTHTISVAKEIDDTRPETIVRAWSEALEEGLRGAATTLTETAPPVEP